MRCAALGVRGRSDPEALAPGGRSPCAVTVVHHRRRCSQSRMITRAPHSLDRVTVSSFLSGWCRCRLVLRSCVCRTICVSSVPLSHTTTNTYSTITTDRRLDTHDPYKPESHWHTHCRDTDSQRRVVLDIQVLGIGPHFSPKIQIK